MKNKQEDYDDPLSLYCVAYYKYVTTVVKAFLTKEQNHYFKISWYR